MLGLLGALLGIIGLGLLGAGAVLLAVFGTDGQAKVPIGSLSSDEGRAVVVRDFEIDSDTPVPVDESWFDLRLEVTGKQPLFVGVAPKADTLEYLRGVPYELVTDVDTVTDSVESTTIPGDRVPEEAAAQAFWSDQQSGRAATVAWPVSNADTTLVVMNEDVSRGVDAHVAVLATISWAGSAAIGMAIAGLVVAGVAIAVLVVAFRAGPPQPQPGV